MNDERPIEKLLRRAAQKRNDEAGAPPELHPANRRLLQAEVTRQFPPAKGPERAAAPPFWMALTRRWAYALALLPVIGLLALVVLPSLSKSKSKSAMELAKIAPAEVASAPAMAADEALAPTASPAAALAVSPETTSPVALGVSGGGNLRNRNIDRPTITTPPPAGLPQVRADHDVAAGREFAGAATGAADSLGVNRVKEQVAPRFENMPESARKSAKSESFNRTVPATVATATASTRSAAIGGISGAPAAGAIIPGAPVSNQGAKLEARSFTTNASVAQVNALTASSSLAAKDTAGTVVVTGRTQDGFFADKAWLARGGGEGGGGAERQRAVLNSQAFSNLGVAQAEAKRKDARVNQLTPPVLMNFKVEQAGRDLRVVDGDGSVYRGVVDEGNTLYKQFSERQQQKLMLANDSKFKFQAPKQVDAISQTKQLDVETYYLYRVEGTNRTLNQKVVFTWNFVDTNALANGDLNYQNVQQKLDATKLPSQFPALLQNSYINGRAQFGEGREIEINAVPEK